MDQRSWIEEDTSAMARGWIIRHITGAIEYSKSLPKYGQVVISTTGKDIEPSSVSIFCGGQHIKISTVNFDSSLWLAWDLCGRSKGLLESHLTSAAP